MKRIPLLVIALGALLGSVFFPSRAQALPPTGEIILEIQADIDGRSQLILQGATAQWQHFDFAAPGRHEFTNYPTVINGVAWYPTWPDIPDAENRDCNCFSSTFTGVVPALPMQPFAAELEVVSVVREDPTQPAGTVSIVQPPTAENNYTLIVEFDDNLPLGSAFYTIRLRIFTVPVIDIKPSSPHNPLNPNSQGLTPVAILTTASFDATQVDPLSVRFGASGTEAAPVRYMWADVEGDGDTDLLLLFHTPETGFVCGDTTATLTGLTTRGQAFSNTTDLQTVGCRGF